eukprot:TRINITY_DN23500_c0_g1_i2.p2 TRINITY_DN23500_c0_g1~~TRINITY_DN23500_c0_g1_i2.p2  ORF type:complete len:102 (+),score=24.67 TRINITY_DN23500_c0_g1_i2:279-584(+)
MVLPKETPRYVVHTPQHDPTQHKKESLRELMSRGFRVPRQSAGGVLANCTILPVRCPVDVMKQLKERGRATVLICEAATGKSWRGKREQAQRLKVEAVDWT